MCGITGIFQLNTNKVSEQDIKTMISSIKHRGPDGDGFFINDTVALGHTRLSIIDLSSNGNQPFYSLDERFVLVFNGEIYNYLEIREELQSEFDFKTNSDTEVLLFSFIKWGDKCMHRFNGMFAFAIYDKLKDELFCARDRFGVKPFYYYQDETRFVFSSEPIGIISIFKEKPVPDYQQIYDYLIFNRTDHDDDTFFKNIKKLNHGSTVSIKNKQVKINRWYKLKERAGNSFTSADEYYNSLKDSIKLRLRSDVPVGLTLSGGLDSSTIAGILMTEFDKKDVNTFSAVYGNNQTGDESKFIDLFKGKLSNMHFIYPTAENLLKDLEEFVEAQQEPFGTTSIYASYSIMKEANDRVKVMLNGQGADEHLAGYHYFFGNYFLILFKRFKWIKLLRENINYYRTYKSAFAIKSFIYISLPKRWQSKIKVSEKGILYKAFSTKYDKSSTIPEKLFGSDTLNKSLLNHFEYKLEHLLKWDDRNSMRFGIESRNPFLDYRLIERSITMDEKFKIDNGMTKTILRKAIKGIVPDEIRNRKDKVGFETPEDEWFRREDFQKVIWGILESDSFNNRGIIDPLVARQQYQIHLNKEGNLAREIWKWVNLELWFRKFID